MKAAAQKANATEFFAVLTAELRSQIRQEILAELAAVSAAKTNAKAQVFGAERTELWLHTHLQVRQQPTRRTPSTSYQNSSSVKTTDPQNDQQRPLLSASQPSRPAHKLDAGDLAAIELFRRYGVIISEHFDAEELRRAFRQLALATHPDRHTQTQANEGSPNDPEKWSQAFAAVSEMVERLSRHLTA